MNIIPAAAGVGLKPQHVDAILREPSAVCWFEVHAENYMGAGGAPHDRLRRIAERYPLSVHGVGLSIGGAGDLDRTHLDRLKGVVDRYRPALVSEHLAWSSHQGRCFNDLLALPYTEATLRLVCDHVDQVQTHLGRRILIENPSTYVVFDESDWAETAFIGEIVRRTGCGLLLDVNNVWVSCVNHGWDPDAYIARIPADAVGEIHLAGHAEDSDGVGPVLIDAHDRPIADVVWRLFERALARTGPVPVLIEWDNHVPEWPVLAAEAEKAGRLLESISTLKDRRHVA